MAHLCIADLWVWTYRRFSAYYETSCRTILRPAEKFSRVVGRAGGGQLVRGRGRGRLHGHRVLDSVAAVNDLQGGLSRNTKLKTYNFYFFFYFLQFFDVDF